MRSLFPSTYDRADVLMSAGCSTFVSSALILVIPRVGIVLLEILLGLFFIGCALAARAFTGKGRTPGFDQCESEMVRQVRRSHDSDRNRNLQQCV